MAFSRRTKIALVVFGVILSVVTPAAFVAAETFLASFYSTSSGIHFNATDGPEVITTKDYNIQSGNPFTEKSFNLSTQNNGWINISTTDADSSTMVVTVDEINGTWTNVSSVAAPTGSNITFQPSDKNFTRVAGDVNTFKFRDIKVDDSTEDFRYTASSETTIVVETNATEGTAYGMVDPDTLEGLDVAVADANGIVVFDEAPAQSSTQAVRVEQLGTLTIREETSPHSTVTGCTVTVKFFEDVSDSPTIEERTDSDGDGEIDLTGLPIDEQFSVTADCSGYHNRTAILNDLSQQKTMFLLNQSVSSLENRFTVEDRTGNFPSEDTEIIIQKAINRTEYGGSPDGFSWTAMAGDDLGADEAFTVDLEEDDRYRIKVQNEAGDSRILGAYTPTTSGTINLVIGRVVLDPTEDDLPSWSGNWTNTSGTEQVNFEYNDSDSNTTTIWLEIYEYNNESNELLSNTSFTNGPFGTFSNTETVPAGEEDTTWVIRFTAERSGDLETIQHEIIVGPQQPLLPSLPPYLVSILFVATMWMVAGLFSQLNGHLGGLVVAGLGAMFYFVDLAPPELGAGVMILSLVTAGIIFVNESRGGL